jgi:hypothetical protein
MDNRWQRVRGLAFAVWALAWAGCHSSAGAGKGGMNYARITALASVYSGYVSTHKKQSPPNEREFRKYLDAKNSELQKLGLTTDDIFVSPRDGQPLQWIYGKPVPGRAGTQYFAYEKSPVRDKRLVIGTGGMYELMDDAQFKSVFPNGP